MDSIKILLMTDSHLGYKERDPVLGDDSFLAAEEILSIARTRGVDMILHGGDLFHENKPSRQTLHRTIRLFREYCFGGERSGLECLGPAEPGLDVNFRDDNYRVAIPVFGIHGNHDDPAGEGNLSEMDLLDAAGLINFFGRVGDVDNIRLVPILLGKGNIRVALYGMGHVRDERLYRSIQRKRVRVLRPAESTTEWFNILAVHQNRVHHTSTGFLPEHFIDPVFDFVFWGHEHECLLGTRQNVQHGFHVCQPGSSIATSLNAGEAKPKHVAILTVHGDKRFSVENIPLERVRPLLLGEMSLPDSPELLAKQAEQLLADKVREMIGSGESKPLVRLRVEYSSKHLAINVPRFGQLFADRVANPRDMLHLVRKRSAPVREQSGPVTVERGMEIDHLVAQTLAQQKLELLSEIGLGEAVRVFVEKDDRLAIQLFLQNSLERVCSGFVERQRPFDEKSLMMEIERQKRMAMESVTPMDPEW